MNSISKDFISDENAFFYDQLEKGNKDVLGVVLVENYDRLALVKTETLQARADMKPFEEALNQAKDLEKKYKEDYTDNSSYLEIQKKWDAKKREKEQTEKERLHLNWEIDRHLSSMSKNHAKRILIEEQEGDVPLTLRLQTNISFYSTSKKSRIKMKNEGKLLDMKLERFVVQLSQIKSQIDNIKNNHLKSLDPTRVFYLEDQVAQLQKQYTSSLSALHQHETQMSEAEKNFRLSFYQETGNDDIKKKIKNHFDLWVCTQKNANEEPKKENLNEEMVLICSLNKNGVLGNQNRVSDEKKLDVSSEKEKTTALNPGVFSKIMK